MLQKLVQSLFFQELNSRCPKDSFEQGTFKCPPSEKVSNAKTSDFSEIDNSKIYGAIDTASKLIQNVSKEREDYFFSIKALGQDKLDSMTEEERRKVIERGNKLDDALRNAYKEYQLASEPLYKEYKAIKNEILTEYAIEKGEDPKNVIYRSALGMYPEEIIPKLDNIHKKLFRTTKGDSGILRKKKPQKSQ